MRLPRIGGRHYMDTMLIQQALEDFYQRALLVDREATQGVRWFRHAFQHGRTEARSRWSELKHFDPPVLGRGLALDEAA